MNAYLSKLRLESFRYDTITSNQKAAFTFEGKLFVGIFPRCSNRYIILCFKKTYPNRKPHPTTKCSYHRRSETPMLIIRLACLISRFHRRFDARAFLRCGALSSRTPCTQAPTEEACRISKSPARGQSASSESLLLLAVGCWIRKWAIDARGTLRKCNFDFWLGRPIER